jgi:hypothetical protein
VLDTRDDTGGHHGPFGVGETATLQVTGSRDGGGLPSGVPASGVSGVVLNVTVTNPTASSYLTLYPADAQRPTASNVNFAAGQTVPNRVMVRLSSTLASLGQLAIYNAMGTADVIIDVAGWYTDGTAGGTGSSFVGIVPVRLLDTRNGTGSYFTPAGQTPLTLQVGGRVGVPSNATAVVVNVTVTGPSMPTYVTVWPHGSPRPVASDINVVKGQTVANLVVVKLGSNGNIDIFNAAGTSEVILEVVGWYR